MRLLVAATSDAPPEGAAAAARGWFARARAADPDHFQALVRYVESLGADPEAMSDEARDMLLQASRLAPQVASIALNAANMLIARGDYDAAIELLEPLAANPHDQGLAEVARRLLDRAERRMTGPARAWADDEEKPDEEPAEAEPAAEAQ
jgi:tetratricopeptide (TPR) repeat protein